MIRQQYKYEFVKNNEITEIIIAILFKPHKFISWDKPGNNDELGFFILF